MSASLTVRFDTAAEEEAERKKAAKKAQKAGSKAKKGKIPTYARRNVD